jgi:hypothetical protein
LSNSIGRLATELVQFSGGDEQSMRTGEANNNYQIAANFLWLMSVRKSNDIEI